MQSPRAELLEWFMCLSRELLFDFSPCSYTCAINTHFDEWSDDGRSSAGSGITLECLYPSSPYLPTICPGALAANRRGKADPSFPLPTHVLLYYPSLPQGFAWRHFNAFESVFFIEIHLFAIKNRIWGCCPLPSHPTHLALSWRDGDGRLQFLSWPSAISALCPRKMSNLSTCSGKLHLRYAQKRKKNPSTRVWILCAFTMTKQSLRGLSAHKPAGKGSSSLRS